MRTSALTVIAAAVLAGGSFGLLAGCSEAPGRRTGRLARAVAAPRPISRSRRSTASTDRAPLGLEVRYVDADGKFRTVAPEDFPR